MESLVKFLFDFDKIPSKLMLIICFLSSIILFVPLKFLAKVKLDTFYMDHGQWAGIGFVSSVSFLAVTVVTYVATTRKNNKKAREEKKLKQEYREQIEKEIRTNLQRLDPVEGSVLREFYIVGSTVNLPIKAGNAYPTDSQISLT